MYIFFLFLFLLILTVFDCFALSDDSLISKPDLFGESLFSHPLISYDDLNLYRVPKFFFDVFLYWLSKGIDGSTDDSPINFGSPIGGNTDEDYSEFEKYLPLVDATEPPTLFTMDPDFNTDPLFTTEIGTDGTSSIFADASQGDCSFGISLLPDRLKKQRRGVTSCHSPYSSSRDSDTVPGDSVGGAALNVDPKVAPYLNIETMELNEICPAQSLINQYYIPVCSSSVKGYTKRYPPVLPTYWQLMDAQLSKYSTYSCTPPPPLARDSIEKRRIDP